MNRGLRNRLAIPDWERRIFVSTVADSGWHEEVPRSEIYGVKYREVLYALLVQQLDEAPARTAKLVLYGRCHHVSAEASMA